MENPIKMDDLGVPAFKEPPKYSSDGLKPPDLDDEPLGIIQPPNRAFLAHHAPLSALKMEEF